ncbi:MAG: ferrochelatase [bacterium]|nr:ferrochelatase [bacterium]
MKKKLAVILLAMGGPNSTADIPEFLYNIFSDRAIIRLPGGAVLQKPFARLISRLRSKNVAEHYSHIGGGSPLLKWTQAQARLIGDHLQRDFDEVTCYIGMRYFRPSIETAIKSAVEDGYEQICFLPLYPQFATATTGSSFAVARDVLKTYSQMKATYINDFHDNVEYTRLLGAYIDRNIQPGETLMFSAHSLPQKFVDEGDPYVEQVKKTAAMSAGKREYHLAFQSRTGPVKWVGPDTVVEVKRLLEDPERKLFIVPISFVCDHIETLYELDIQLKELVGEEKGSRIRRMPMFNDDPSFGRILAELIRAKVGENVSK